MALDAAATDAKKLRFCFRQEMIELRRWPYPNAAPALFLVSKNGYVTWPQRFGSALNANIHYHTITVDGVFALPGPEEEKPTFAQLDAPDAAEL